MARLTIEQLWRDFDFTPNEKQREAILHTEGPLYLPAGPGSGKTRVLLWRSLNLIAFHDVSPDDIYLSTFTEKAALQLKEGLQTLLAAATNATRKPYDRSDVRRDRPLTMPAHPDGSTLLSQPTARARTGTLR